MIPPSQFLKYIIRPVLNHLSKENSRLGGRAAEQLMLGTAISESNLEDLEQIGGGPASSMFQIEPTTFDDVYHRYLETQNPDLLSLVNDFCFAGMKDLHVIKELTGNQHFACAIARVKYWMVPAPLPAAGDIKGMGQYWKLHYNTPLGKGKARDFVRKIGPHLNNWDEER